MKQLCIYANVKCLYVYAYTQTPSLLLVYSFIPAEYVFLSFLLEPCRASQIC